MFLKNEPYIALNCVSGNLKFKIFWGRTPGPSASLASQTVPSPELPPKQKFLDRTLLDQTNFLLVQCYEKPNKVASNKSASSSSQSSMKWFLHEEYVPEASLNGGMAKTIEIL